MSETGIERADSAAGVVDDFSRVISADVPLPICVQIETTTRCNLRCIMCPKGANGEVMGDLDLGVLGHIGGLIDSAREIRAHGFGETFLHHDFEKILRRCAEAPTNVKIVTNGTLIDEERARLLVDASVNRIYVSVDAADPALFQVIRKTRLEKIVNNLNRLRAIKEELGAQRPLVTLQMVGMSNNIHDLPNMVRLAASVGADEVHLVAFFEFDMETIRSFELRSLLECPDQARKFLAEALPLAEDLGIRLEIAPTYQELVPPRTEWAASLAPKPLAPLRRDLDRARSALARLRSGEVRGFVAGLRRELHHRLGSLRSALAQKLPRRPAAEAGSPVATPAPSRPAPRPATCSRVRCQDPWDSVVINYKGEVNPCCMSQRVMGNVNQSSFEEIWDGEPYRKFREELLSETPPPECRSCGKAGWYTPYELEDWLEVGVNDLFGVQIGTGWSEELDGTRWTRKQAFLRLRNTGKRRLRMMLVSWPGAWLALDQQGEIYVNDVRVGGFELSSLDPKPFVFELPASDAQELQVRIACEREYIPHVLGGHGDVRRLGVGLRSAALVE